MRLSRSLRSLGRKHVGASRLLPTCLRPLAKRYKP